VTGQEISWSRAARITVRPPSAAAAPAEARSLLISSLGAQTLQKQHAGLLELDAQPSAAGIRPP
jgi:hypothetical protein